jgi:hypothetical protein
LRDPVVPVPIGEAGVRSPALDEIFNLPGIRTLRILQDIPVSRLGARWRGEATTVHVVVCCGRGAQDLVQLEGRVSSALQSIKERGACWENDRGVVKHDGDDRDVSR